MASRRRELSCRAAAPFSAPACWGQSPSRSGSEPRHKGGCTPFLPQETASVRSSPEECVERQGAHFPAMETDGAVATLKGLFPNMPEAKLLDAVLECGGDAQQAADRVLQDSGAAARPCCLPARIRSSGDRRGAAGSRARPGPRPAAATAAAGVACRVTASRPSERERARRARTQ